MVSASGECLPNTRTVTGLVLLNWRLDCPHVIADAACTSTTPEALMKELCKQFGSNVSKKQAFHVGYMKGSVKVPIRTPQI